MRERARSLLLYGFLLSIALHLIVGPLVRFPRTTPPPERVELVRVERMPTPPPTAPPTRPPTPPPTPTPPPQPRTPPPPRSVPVRHVAPKTTVRRDAPPREAVDVPQAPVQPGEPTTAPVHVVATPVPVAVSTPQVVVATAPPAPAATIDPSIIAAYNARLNAAVQAAFRVPSVAAEMGFKGRVRVEFTLRDGIVGEIHILQPSGLPMVDRAALAAVQTAKYPLPPTLLQGKNGIYQIWVVVS